MALVFIHGVGVRIDSEDDQQLYKREVKVRNDYFRIFVLRDLCSDCQNTQIFNPFWGNDGVSFAWNCASLPDIDVELLGPGSELPAFLAQTQLDRVPEDANTFVLELARQSLLDAVDLLWAVSAESVNDETQSQQLVNLAVQAVSYASCYENTTEQPEWINDKEVRNDDQFLGRLSQEIDEWMLAKNPLLKESREELGSNQLWELIRRGRRRLKGAAFDLVGRRVIDILRPKIHKRAAYFIGDVFTYIHERGTRENPGQIVTKVLQDLEEARQLSDEREEPLIVVAHSMGGNIAYDILTYFKPKLDVDVLVTVGSQVSLFAEMRLFRTSSRDFPTQPQYDRLPKPSEVKHWLNIYDPNDILGFWTNGVFEDEVRNFQCLTTNAKPHVGFFEYPSFYDKLGKRIREVL